MVDETDIKSSNIYHLTISHLPSHFLSNQIVGSILQFLVSTEKLEKERFNVIIPTILFLGDEMMMMVEMNFMRW